MSTKLQDAQSRYSIENKAGYQKLYELKNA
jgi:hypothetical protein